MAKKPDHDLPDSPEIDPQRIPVLPILIAPPLLPDGPPDPPSRRPGEVGVVHFEKMDGSNNGSATYHVPVAMRDRILLWRHQYHEQNHLNDAGEWVYRLTHTSGVTGDDTDPNLEPIAETVVNTEE